MVGPEPPTPYSVSLPCSQSFFRCFSSSIPLWFSVLPLSLSRPSRTPISNPGVRQIAASGGMQLSAARWIWFHWLNVGASCESSGAYCVTDFP